MAKYEKKYIWIVQCAENENIHKIFGVERFAKEYLAEINKDKDQKSVINEWPVEFEMTGPANSQD